MKGKETEASEQNGYSIWTLQLKYVALTLDFQSQASDLTLDFQTQVSDPRILFWRQPLLDTAGESGSSLTRQSHTKYLLTPNVILQSGQIYFLF